MIGGQDMIFCVEDDSSIRELIIYTLQNTGFDAQGFESGKELFAAMTHTLPDLYYLGHYASRRRRNYYFKENQIKYRDKRYTYYAAHRKRKRIR